MTEASSSGVPKRPAGVAASMSFIIGCCSNSWRPMGVSMRPGASELTRPPRGAPRHRGPSGGPDHPDLGHAVGEAAVGECGGGLVEEARCQRIAEQVLDLGRRRTGRTGRRPTTSSRRPRSRAPRATRRRRAPVGSRPDRPRTPAGRHPSWGRCRRRGSAPATDRARRRGREGVTAAGSDTSHGRPTVPSMSGACRSTATSDLGQPSQLLHARPAHAAGCAGHDCGRHVDLRGGSDIDVESDVDDSSLLASSPPGDRR